MSKTEAQVRVSEHKYDLTLFVGNDDLGTLVANYIPEHLAKELRWTIIGSNVESWNAWAERSKDAWPDRQPPEIQLLSNNTDDIVATVKKSKVVINLPHPSRESESIIEACANNGIHCVLSTSQTPFLSSIITKYHTTATQTGAIIIPALTSHAAPQDILTLTSITELRKKLNLSTREVVCAHRKPPPLTSKPQSKLNADQGNKDPWILSPRRSRLVSDGTNIFGNRKELTLGCLIKSKAQSAQAIVHRRWGLNVDRKDGSVYGEKFVFNEFVESDKSSGSFKRMVLGGCCGGRRESIIYDKSPSGGFSMRAVAIADQEGPYPDRALSEMAYAGDEEHLSVLLLVQGAATLLALHGREETGQGGVLTPATLGMDFVERLRVAGVEIESSLV